MNASIFIGFLVLIIIVRIYINVYLFMCLNIGKGIGICETKELCNLSNCY